MWLISNELLMDSYYKAIDMRLEPDFIDILSREINRRNLHMSISSIQKNHTVH